MLKIETTIEGNFTIVEMDKKIKEQLHEFVDNIDKREYKDFGICPYQEDLDEDIYYVDFNATLIPTAELNDLLIIKHNYNVLVDLLNDTE